MIEREKDILGIEIKASRNVGSRDFRGLSSLAEVAGRNKRFRKWIIYLGDKKQLFENGPMVLPYQDALRLLFLD